MQVSFNSFALKPFTRALLCLSKYGEELTVYATADVFSLSCTNSSKSAYCRFRFNKEFFFKYRLGNDHTNDEEPPHVAGQLTTRSLLSILKHKTVESTLERCEISIVDGTPESNSKISDDGHDNNEVDNFESRLVVRLHCKHGVVKTHRLNLNTPTSLLAPGIPDTDNESVLNVGHRTIKHIIDFFPLIKNTRSDPQLIWSFGETEVVVRSLESSLDSRGKAQLATELTISSEEFQNYDLYAVPTTIAFHLKEFNATISFADSSSLELDIRFTDPTAPLFIEVEGDSFEGLFVISTSQVQTSQAEAKLIREGSVPTKKRLREESAAGETPRFKKPMKVVQTTDRTSMARDVSMARETPMPPPRRRPSTAEQSYSSTPLPATPVPLFQRSDWFQPDASELPPSSLPVPILEGNQRDSDREPLFLPSSQLSILDEAALRESGLGIENMTTEEFNAMMEEEGEETDGDIRQSDYGSDYRGDEIMALQPTQTSEANESKAFYPLFND